MALYSHMFTLAFTVETHHTGEEDDPVPVEELKVGLAKRVQDLEDNSEWHEAVGGPFDTYVVSQPKYLLVPGLVRSKTGGDSHHMSEVDLAVLYGVRLGDCLVLPHPTPDNVEVRHDLLERVFTGELIALAPRYDGVYKLPGA